MKAFTFMLPVAFTLIVAPCFGQMTPSMINSSMRTLSNGALQIRSTYKMEPGPMPVMQGEPFSLKRFWQKNQALADGTAVSKQTPAIMQYRDSAGRFRVEYPFKIASNPALAGCDLPVQIEILDPVAGYHYIIDTAHRIVHRGVIEVRTPQPLPKSATPNPPGRTIVPGDSIRPQRSIESLGGRVIDGQALEGRRMTTTYPAGSTMGNDGPVTITSEEWISPGSTMPPNFRKTDDPRSGTEIAASYDIDRAEPDPSLFQPPVDFQLVDEPGPFAITFTYINKKLVQ